MALSRNALFILTGLFQILQFTESSLLFILHDAGESYMALEPVTSLIELGIELNVLVLGEPASTIYTNISNRVTLNDIGINVTILDGTTEARAQILSEDDVDMIVSFFSSSVDGAPPDVVCVGMVYTMESQLSLAFKTQQPPSYIVGLDDSFSLWSNNSLPAELFVKSYGNDPSGSGGVADEVFTTADSISAGLASYSEAQNSHVLATTVGSPTLEAWAQDLANTDEIVKTRSLILNNYADVDNFDEIVILIYAGAYGGDQYTNALKLLCSVAQELKQNGFLFVFSPHPGYPSTYEASLFDDWNCGNALLVYNESEWGCSLNTSQLVVASNGSFSEASTVGGQSLSVTKPHTYTSISFQDVFTASNLIPTSPESNSLVHTINVTFALEGYCVDDQAMAEAGVPLNGTANIVNRLLAVNNQ